jgi:hypothetical protein
MNSLRYKYNSKPNLVLNTKRVYQTGFGLKPNGFWYGYGKDWEKFLINEWKNFRKKNPYKYNISIPNTYYTKKLTDISKEKILVLDSIENIDEFMKKYSVEMNDNLGDKFIIIDWKKFSNDFSGIEIRKLPDSKILHKINTKTGLLENKYRWLRILDGPSGCIWNFKNIQITITKNN